MRKAEWRSLSGTSATEPAVACRHDAVYSWRGSWEDRFLRKAGFDVSGASQSDGAGGDAYFTPDFMVHYLMYLARQDAIFPSLLQALPVMGKDGTLWDIQAGSPAAGHVRAKTGTMGGADLLHHSLMIAGKGMAGYIDRKDGRRLAFAAYIGMVDGDPETIMHQAGNLLGEIAGAAYGAPPEFDTRLPV